MRKNYNNNSLVCRVVSVLLDAKPDKMTGTWCGSRSGLITLCKCLTLSIKGPRTLQLNLQKKQLCTMHTTTFHNCNNFPTVSYFDNDFHNNIFWKISAVSVVVCKGLHTDSTLQGFTWLISVFDRDGEILGYMCPLQVSKNQFTQILLTLSAMVRRVTHAWAVLCPHFLFAVT